MCVCMFMHVRVQVPWYTWEVSPTCGSRGLNPGYQAWHQAPLPERHLTSLVGYFQKMSLSRNVP